MTSRILESVRVRVCAGEVAIACAWPGSSWGSWRAHAYVGGRYSQRLSRVGVERVCAYARPSNACRSSQRPPMAPADDLRPHADPVRRSSRAHVLRMPILTNHYKRRYRSPELTYRSTCRSRVQGPRSTHTRIYARLTSMHHVTRSPFQSVTGSVTDEPGSCADRSSPTLLTPVRTCAILSVPYQLRCVFLA